MSTDFVRGATIPELIVMIAVVGILAGLLFGPFNDLYNNNSQGLNTIVQTADTRAALRTIEQDITYASRFLSENTINDLAGNIPNKPGTKWAWTGNPNTDANKRVLIAEAYGTTTTSSTNVEASREIVFNRSNCSQQIPLTINLVYFIKDNNLFRRTLKGVSTNSTDGCDSKVIGQPRTCTAAYNNPTYCQAIDALIIKDVSTFDIHYYLNSNAADPIPEEYTDGSTLTNAKTVVLTLTTTSGVGNNAKSVTSNLRITRIN